MAISAAVGARLPPRAPPSEAASVSRAGGDGAASMGSPGEEDVGSNFGAPPPPSGLARWRSTGNRVRSNVPARLRALSFATLEKTEE